MLYHNFLLCFFLLKDKIDEIVDKIEFYTSSVIFFPCVSNDNKMKKKKKKKKKMCTHIWQKSVMMWFIGEWLKRRLRVVTSDGVT